VPVYSGHFSAIPYVVVVKKPLGIFTHLVPFHWRMSLSVRLVSWTSPCPGIVRYKSSNLWILALKIVPQPEHAHLILSNVLPLIAVILFLWSYINRITCPNSCISFLPYYTTIIISNMKRMCPCLIVVKTMCACYNIYPTTCRYFVL